MQERYIKYVELESADEDNSTVINLNEIALTRGVPQDGGNYKVKVVLKSGITETLILDEAEWQKFKEFIY